MNLSMKFNIKLIEIYDFIWTAFRQIYWLSNYEVCDQWDIRILSLISKNSEVTRISNHVVKVGNHYIWDSNYPYAYGYDHEDKTVNHKLPRNRTRKLLRDFIVAKLGEDKKSEFRT